jgi:hypothetical protein
VAVAGETRRGQEDTSFLCRQVFSNGTTSQATADARTRLAPGEPDIEVVVVDVVAAVNGCRAAGRRTATLAWLEKAYEERSGWLALWLKIDPAFDSLRADDRFRDLLTRVGHMP